jgi:hypothetical protein
VELVHEAFLERVEQLVRHKREEELKGTTHEGEQQLIDSSVQACKERMQQRLRLVVNGISSCLQWDTTYKRTPEEEEAWTAT